MTMRKLLVAAGLLLAALSISRNTSSVLRERKAALPISGIYCEPDIKTHKNPIIFVHGLHEGKWVWEDMSEKFCERGYSTFRFDLRQHGGNRGARFDISVSVGDYREDVRSVVREVTRKYGHAPILIGHSLGGLLALGAGAEREVKSLVLIAPAPPNGVPREVPPWVAKKSFINKIRSVWTILSEPVVYIGYREVSGRISEWSSEKQKAYLKKLVPEPSRVVRDIVCGNITVPPASISVPMLVISGTIDDIVPVQSSRRVAKKYNADFMEFEGNGHFIIIEPGWKDVANAIHAWLLLPGSKTVPSSIVATQP